MESCFPNACLSVRGIVLLNVLWCPPHFFFFFAFGLNTIVRCFFSHGFKSQYVKVIPSLVMELRDTKSWVYIMNIFIVSNLKQNSHIPDNHLLDTGARSCSGRIQYLRKTEFHGSIMFLRKALEERADYCLGRNSDPSLSPLLLLSFLDSHFFVNLINSDKSTNFFVQLANNKLSKGLKNIDHIYLSKRRETYFPILAALMTISFITTAHIQTLESSFTPPCRLVNQCIAENCICLS